MIDKIGREILKTLRIYRKPLIDRDIEGDRIVIEFEVPSLGDVAAPPYRVIQWGTGAVGAEMITAILDLVGVKVYSRAKHGYAAAGTSPGSGGPSGSTKSRSAV